MPTDNKDYLCNNQYKNAVNLSVRQALYHYSENPTPFWTWVAKHYQILPKNKILEVGCGNGMFWHEALKVLPQDLDITLTDFSNGMLEDAKINLSKISHFKFGIEDVEHLSFSECFFDTVLAHFMLYHANSPQQALLEIKRVLKPSGFCGILLPSNNHMQELFSILECENPRHGLFFSAENAISILPKFFSSIEQYIYQDTFKITDVPLLISYLRSLPRMNEKTKEFYEHCEQKLINHIAAKGYVHLSSTQHLFVAIK